MDVKVHDGDINVTSSGDYVYITGLQEAVQRVRIAVTTVKGSFVYDRDLGTDYSGLRIDDPLLPEKLELLWQEACADIGDTTVELAAWRPNTVTAELRIGYLDQKVMTEVDLSGII